MSTILKKMSIKALGCDPKEAREKKYAPGATIKQENGTLTPSDVAGKKIPLCIVYGRASGIKSGENRSGNSEIWTALTGEFVGVRTQVMSDDTPETDLQFTSGMLFLPGGIQETIEGAMDNAGEGGVVEFALEIMCGYDESQIGYKYFGRNLKPPAATDDLAHLRGLIQPLVPKVHLGPAATVKPAEIAPAPTPVAVAEAPAPAPAPMEVAKQGKRR